MQEAKNAAASVKETTSNVVASARSGMEKTPRSLPKRRWEKLTAHDQVEKQRAMEKKQEKIHHAELGKQKAHEHNAASKQSTPATGRMAPTPTGGTTTFSASGGPVNPSGGHQI